MAIQSESEPGHQLVISLMERQDAVLDELDRLNDRVESMIRELSAQRADDAAKVVSEHSDKRAA